MKVHISLVNEILCAQFIDGTKISTGDAIGLANALIASKVQAQNVTIERNLDSSPTTGQTIAILGKMREHEKQILL